MNVKEADFKVTSGNNLTKKESRSKIPDKAIEYFSDLKKNKKHFSDIEHIRNIASTTRRKSIENLDKLLIEFEANLIKRGGKIIWAQDKNEASVQIKKLLKISSSVYLPATRGNLINECAIDTAFSSAHKAENYTTAIAEADFLAANPGAICIMNPEKEFLASELKIILAGIELMLPSVNDFDLFLNLKSVYKFQMPLTYINQIYTGPSQDENGNFTDELYVILIDNGRSKVLNDEIARQSLWCIGCTACYHTDAVCRMAVSENEGNQIPVLIASLPYRTDFNTHFASSDSQIPDGFNSSICPVKIDFTKIILHSRKLAVERQLKSKSEKWFYFFWKKAMLKRVPVLLKGINTYGFFVNSIFNKSEKELRITCRPAKKSFNEQWREKMKL